MIITEPATLEDAKWVAKRIRHSDAREVRAATGKEPIEIAPLSVAVSEMAVTLRSTRAGGDPVAVAGVADPTEGNFGTVWLLGTPALLREPVSLLKWGIEWCPKFVEKYDGLANFVDARNTKHIKWIMALGFFMTKETVPLGPRNKPFHAFFQTKEEICALL